MKTEQPSLSVCCLTNGPLAQTAAILEQLSGVADEIVCATDIRVPISELAELDGRADVVVQCDFDPASGIERNLCWLHSLCSGRWVLRIDSDELLSARLLAALPTLIQANDVTQYLIRRQWSYPDSGHVINEYPWSDDWQIRLVRNEPTLLRFPGQLHSSAELVPPYRFVDDPLYHLDCILTSAEERSAKANRYSAALASPVTERGIPVNNLYLPERIGPVQCSPIPRDDTNHIQEILAATTRPAQVAGRSRRWRSSPDPPPFFGFEDIDRFWALRSVPVTAYYASLELVEQVTAMDVGELRSLTVRVRNNGTESWPWGLQNPEIRLAHRWFAADGETLLSDGIRTPFTATVRPGATALQKMVVTAPDAPGEFSLELNVVHEHVAWFQPGTRILVAVRDGRVGNGEP